MSKNSCDPRIALMPCLRKHEPVFWATLPMTTDHKQRLGGATYTVCWGTFFDDDGEHWFAVEDSFMDSLLDTNVLGAFSSAPLAVKQFEYNGIPTIIEPPCEGFGVGYWEFPSGIPEEKPIVWRNG